MPRGRKPRKQPNPNNVQDKLFRQTQRLVSPATNWLYKHGVKSADAEDLIQEARIKYARFSNPSRIVKARTRYLNEIALIFEHTSPDTIRWRIYVFRNFLIENGLHELLFK